MERWLCCAILKCESKLSLPPRRHDSLCTYNLFSEEPQINLSDYCSIFILSCSKWPSSSPSFSRYQKQEIILRLAHAGSDNIHSTKLGTFREFHHRRSTSWHSQFHEIETWDVAISNIKWRPAILWCKQDAMTNVFVATFAHLPSINTKTCADVIKF